MFQPDSLILRILYLLLEIEISKGHWSEDVVHLYLDKFICFAYNDSHLSSNQQYMYQWSLTRALASCKQSIHVYMKTPGFQAFLVFFLVFLLIPSILNVLLVFQNPPSIPTFK